MSKTLLLVCLLLCAPAAGAESFFQATVDHEYTWDFTAVDEETNIFTDTCSGSSLAVVDATSSSTIKARSCAKADTNESNCTAVGDFDGTPAPANVGITHTQPYLRLTVTDEAAGGTVRVSCTRNGNLGMSELQNEFYPTDRVSVLIAGVNGVASQTDPNTPDVVCPLADGTCVYKASNGTWWGCTATNGVTTSTWTAW